MYKHIISLVVLLLSLIVVPHVHAKVIVEEKGTIIIREEEIINDDLFIVGESIKISGTVDGDVYAAAGNINVDGQISGDLVVVGGNLTVNSAVIGDSLIVGAGQVTIDDDSQIKGSLIIGSGSLHNQAPIGRNAMIGSGEVYLDSTVGKEARIGAGTLTLGPNTKIGGDLTYALGEETSELNLSDEATIAGTVQKFSPPDNWSRQDKVSPEKLYTSWSILSFLSSLLVGLLALRLLPKSAKAVSSIASNHTLRSLGTGLLAIIVVFPMFLLLLFTGVGAPLGFILLSIFLVYLYLSSLVTSQIVGIWLTAQFGKKWTSYAMFITGLTALSIVKFIPFFGWLIGFAACLIGLGALLSYTRTLGGH